MRIITYIYLKSEIMAPPRVIDWKDIRPETIVYEGAKNNKHNGLTVPVKYRDPRTGALHPIVFQTPVMSLPFGVSDKVLEKYGRKIEASLCPGYIPPSDNADPSYESAEMREFHDWVSMWDTLNPETVAKNTMAYFKKQISPMVVTELYKCNMKQSTQPDKYAPTVRCKVPCTSDGPTADFWSIEPSGREKVDMNRVKNGSRVIALLKTTGLWFAGKSFGMNFHVIQMVQLASDKFEGCAIQVPAEHIPPALATPPSPSPASAAPAAPPLLVDADGSNGGNKRCGDDCGDNPTAGNNGGLKRQRTMAVNV